jgi:uncharacterized protein YabN with tetrapyrrole methylase and pyrophosphatase domain
MAEKSYWLDNVDPSGSSPLGYANALQAKASEIGFDWPFIDGAIDKITEEINELSAEIDKEADISRLKDEMGDLLFACVNVARMLGLSPDEALDQANQKFYQRFNAVEDKVTESGKTLQESSLSELDELWDVIKEEQEA